jgi:preprotein translocase subunit Sec61beta
MAKDNQVQMPSGQGGLIQYFDEDSGFEIDPKTIVALCGGTAVVMMALHSPFLAV